jgi:hypothetical protein
MKTNILATAVALSDLDLLARLDALAGSERETTAELVGHLAALELRPSLYLAQGYGSLFSYCTQALRLSEDAACNRIHAARACQRFPVILDLLGSGALSLSSVKMLRPHLTAENHEAVLAKAVNRTRRDIEALVAELAPKPDVPASVRKLPVPKMAVPVAELAQSYDAPFASDTAAPSTMGSPTPSPSRPAFPIDRPNDGRPTEASPTHAVRPAARPIVQASAPGRYRVQFTIGQQTHDKLQRVQALLRRETPGGDLAVIFDGALDLVLERVEKAKFGRSSKPERRTDDTWLRRRAYEMRIRPGTDKGEVRASAPAGHVWPESKTAQTQDDRPPSRHIPNAVKRAVWRRDGGQCAFVAVTGRRCSERNFLELHHIRPYALDGSATVGNISLRCRRHNQYEADLLFGPRDPLTVSETREWYQSVPPTP